jgi:hypothetical protein
MKPKIPQPLKSEHEELHAQLLRATKAGGVFRARPVLHKICGSFISCEQDEPIDADDSLD